MKKVNERASVVAPVTQRHKAQAIQRRLAHVAPTLRKFRSQGQAERFKHREKVDTTKLGPTARAHRRFKLYGESKGLDPEEMKKAERKKYQDDVRRGRMDLPQRIARVWRHAQKKGKAGTADRLLKAYKRLPR